MHYTPNVLEAFDSVEHIMRDVHNGWLIRYLHSNTASAFFFLVYLHIGRGLYYGSYKAPRTIVWTIGTVIFILMMATAFLGYNRSPKWHKHNKKNSNDLNNNRYYSTTSKEKYFNILNDFLTDKNLKPVICYEDLQLKKTKDSINKFSKEKSGIYLILNKITLDYYIGSASTNKIYSRYYRHLISFDGSKTVKLAVRKYKLENFAFIILELFPECVNKENNKKLLDIEDFYLKSLLPNYNILTEAGNTFGYKHTEIDRIKMKASYSEEYRAIIGNLNKGKTLSIETKSKLKQKALSRLPSVFSEQALHNMRKKSKSIVLYNKNGTLYGEYNSIKDASISLNCDVKTIARALQTESKILKRRWVVKFE